MNDEFEDSDDDDARVALIPGPGADLPSEIERYVDADLLNLYEVHSYRHAANILSSSQTDEFEQIKNALRRFRLTTDEIRSPGGNETTIVKRITELLRKDGWQETRIFADLKVTKESKRQIVRETRSGKIKLESVKELETVDIPNFVDGHKVDFVKNRVAFDMEWNSKDQTFDRDLYAFRAFYDCSLYKNGNHLTVAAPGGGVRGLFV